MILNRLKLYATFLFSLFALIGNVRDGPLFFWRGGGGGGGMKNIEKNCLQGLKRQNKLFANIICIKKIVCIEVRETFFHFFIF